MAEIEMLTTLTDFDGVETRMDGTIEINAGGMCLVLDIKEARSCLHQLGGAIKVAEEALWEPLDQFGEEASPKEAGADACQIAAVGGRGCEQPDCTCRDHAAGESGEALEGGAA